MVSQIKAIDAVLIDTQFPERLVSFYRDSLGIPLKEETHGSPVHWSCFLNGVYFSIHRVDRSGAHLSNVHFSLLVDSIDAIVEYLRTKNELNLEMAPTDRPFGKLASIRDPDGNLIYLHSE